GNQRGIRRRRREDFHHFAHRPRAAQQESRRHRHSGHAQREKRTGCAQPEHYPRRGASLVTWTSTFGRGCGVLLDAIVRWLALARINPNVLTFMGLVVNTIAALLF